MSNDPICIRPISSFHSIRDSPYPLFESMLRSKGIKMEAIYSCRDIAAIFGVSTRTIQKRIADGTLPDRKLIGGGRFLPIDIETYLSTSNGKRPSRTDPPHSLAVLPITSEICDTSAKPAPEFHPHPKTLR